MPPSSYPDVDSFSETFLLSLAASRLSLSLPSCTFRCDGFRDLSVFRGLISNLSTFFGNPTTSGSFSKSVLSSETSRFSLPLVFSTFEGSSIKDFKVLGPIKSSKSGMMFSFKSMFFM
uniref:Uncharacterized protein n=1 Tax=Cacopsylla melanoneura TaxID=428564 RepID=A0A8D8PQB5_9HEMI